MPPKRNTAKAAAKVAALPDVAVEPPSPVTASEGKPKRAKKAAVEVAAPGSQTFLFLLFFSLVLLLFMDKGYLR
jgi:hypothetical protein